MGLNKRSAFTVVAVLVASANAPAFGQSLWEAEALATLSRVPIGAVPETGLEAAGLARGFALQVGGAPTGPVVAGRINVAASRITPRLNGGSRTLTIGASAGCTECARGVMVGLQRVRRFRGADGSNRIWLLGSTELGIGRVAGMTPLGARLGLTVARVGLPRGATLSLSPGAAFGGYLNAMAIFKPEQGKQLTGAPAGSLRGSLSVPIGRRRVSVGVHHLFITGARTMIGSAVAW
jgi:hypothetical protein